MRTFHAVIISALFAFVLSGATHLLAASKPAATGNPYINYLRIPGWPEPARIAAPDRTEKEQFTISLHADSSAFTEVPAPFEGFVGGEAVWADYDEDGKLDVLVAGFNDTVFTTRIYHNDGNGVFTDIQAGIAGLGTFRGVAWGDYDNDGDLDLAISGAINWEGDSPSTNIYRNDGGVFTNIHAGLFGLNFGSMNWIDYDNDGDLDLFATGSPDKNNFYSLLYRNDDSVFTKVEGTGIVGVWGSCSAWGDFDGDGYQDLALMGWGGYNVTAVYRNLGGTGQFQDIPLGITAIVHGSIAWVDFDNDGRLDLSIEGTSYGYTPVTKVYRNLTSTTVDSSGIPTLTPAFVDMNVNLTPLGVGAMAWGDFDNDGYQDFAISGARDWYGDSSATKIFRNEGGTGEFTEVNISIPGNYSGSLAWGDYDNDGRLDLLIEGATVPSFDMPPTVHFRPLSLILKNTGTTYNTGPAAPATGSISGSSSALLLHWYNGTDHETPANGLTYNLRAGTTPGGIDVIAPNSILETGFRRAPKPGNAGHSRSLMLKHLPAGTYYWSVQTVDNELAGSAFRAERSFTVLSNGGVVENLASGWNLVSDPYGHSDRLTTTLFPGARSSAYRYLSSGGYQAVDEIINGTGYWLKTATNTVPHTTEGTVLGSTTVPVTAGWNLIGSVSVQLLPANVGSSVPGLTVSPFYEYTGSGYVAADAIVPGKGYWVKVSGDGSLILGGTTSMASRVTIVDTGELPPPPPEPELEVPPPSVPTAFGLAGNYPNPFNPSTRIAYDLPEAASVTITVFNILGQQVALISRGTEQAGRHTAAFDASGLASGVYYYTLEAFAAGRQLTGTGKMMLMR